LWIDRRSARAHQVAVSSRSEASAAIIAPDEVVPLGYEGAAEIGRTARARVERDNGVSEPDRPAARVRDSASDSSGVICHGAISNTDCTGTAIANSASRTWTAERLRSSGRVITNRGVGDIDCAGTAIVNASTPSGEKRRIIADRAVEDSDRAGVIAHPTATAGSTIGIHGAVGNIERSALVAKASTAAGTGRVLSHNAGDNIQGSAAEIGDTAPRASAFCES